MLKIFCDLCKREKDGIRDNYPTRAISVRVCENIQISLITSWKVWDKQSLDMPDAYICDTCQKVFISKYFISQDDRPLPPTAEAGILEDRKFHGGTLEVLEKLNEKNLNIEVDMDVRTAEIAELKDKVAELEKTVKLYHHSMHKAQKRAEERMNLLLELERLLPATTLPKEIQEKIEIEKRLVEGHEIKAMTTFRIKVESTSKTPIRAKGVNTLDIRVGYQNAPAFKGIVANLRPMITSGEGDDYFERKAKVLGRSVQLVPIKSSDAEKEFVVGFENRILAEVTRITKEVSSRNNSEIENMIASFLRENYLTEAV